MEGLEALSTRIYVDRVVRPAHEAPPGLRRVWRLCECALAQAQRDWWALVERCLEEAVAAGELGRDTDLGQPAYELIALMETANARQLRQLLHRLNTPAPVPVSSGNTPHGTGGTLLRRINGTALIIAALVVTLGALAFPVWSYADRSGTGQANADAGTVPTRWGPLSTTDRDFLVKVRLAGLWELPAGQQAIERAPSEAIKAAGDHLVVGHSDLDRRAREVAAQLGVELPNQPTEQQQAFLDELTAARGETYERKFANILRDSHGKVFALIAEVRHTTRNTLMRQLASDANQTVLDHITMLENTGLVDFDALANEAAGRASASPTGPPPPSGGVPPSPAPAVPSGDQSFTSRPSAPGTGPVNTGRPAVPETGTGT